jgi:hypothetical protein
MYYNTTYNIWTSTQHNITNNNMKFKDQLEVEFVTTSSYMCKGKAVPLQAWSGPEGSRKLRFPDFLTMAQDGGS